jgi:hypothetical protein
MPIAGAPGHNAARAIAADLKGRVFRKPVQNKDLRRQYPVAE